MHYICGYSANREYEQLILHTLNGTNEKPTSKKLDYRVSLKSTHIGNLINYIFFASAD